MYQDAPVLPYARLVAVAAVAALLSPGRRRSAFTLLQPRCVVVLCPHPAAASSVKALVKILH